MGEEEGEEKCRGTCLVFMLEELFYTPIPVLAAHVEPREEPHISPPLFYFLLLLSKADQSTSAYFFEYAHQWAFSFHQSFPDKILQL